MNAIEFLKGIVEDHGILSCDLLRSQGLDIECCQVCHDHKQFIGSFIYFDESTGTWAEYRVPNLLCCCQAQVALVDKFPAPFKVKVEDLPKPFPVE